MKKGCLNLLLIIGFLVISRLYANEELPDTILKLPKLGTGNKYATFSQHLLQAIIRRDVEKVGKLLHAGMPPELSGMPVRDGSFVHLAYKMEEYFMSANKTFHRKACSREEYKIYIHKLLDLYLKYKGNLYQNDSKSQRFALQNNDTRSLLILAICIDHNAVKKVIRAGYRINFQNKKQIEEILKTCINCKNFESLKYFIKLGGEKLDLNDYDLLHIACGKFVSSFLGRYKVEYQWSISLEIIEYLLQHGLKTNKKDKKGYTALHMIAQNYNSKYLKAAKLLLKYHADPNITNSIGESPLFTCCQNGKNLEMVKLLVENEADINFSLQVKINEKTYLLRLGDICALSDNNFQILNYLHQHGAKINPKLWRKRKLHSKQETKPKTDNNEDFKLPKLGNTVYFTKKRYINNLIELSMVTLDVTIIEQLLKNGMPTNYNYVSLFGNPPEGFTFISHLTLISTFNEIIRGNKQLHTPPITTEEYSAYMKKVTALYFKYGGKMYQNTGRFSILLAAARIGDCSYIKYVIDSGYNIKTMSKKEAFRVLRRCVERGDLESIKYLRSLGFNLFLRGKTGQSLLHCATFSWQKDNIPVIEYLLKQGIPVNVKDNRLQTPLHTCCGSSDSTFLNYVEKKRKYIQAKSALCLIKHHANVNAISKYNYTPLYLQLDKYQPNDKNFLMVKLLVKYGANVNYIRRPRGGFMIIDATTASIFDLAYQSKNYKVMKFLHDHGAKVRRHIWAKIEKEHKEKKVCNSLISDKHLSYYKLQVLNIERLNPKKL